jgi:hypothetical protein
VGEGELISVSRRNQRLDLRENLTMAMKISAAVPSPWGEAQDEGELNKTRIREKN